MCGDRTATRPTMLPSAAGDKAASAAAAASGPGGNWAAVSLDALSPITLGDTPALLTEGGGRT